MKPIILLALISLALSNSIINKKIVEKLRKTAPYEVYDVEENPFKDWTDEEIRSMLALKIPKNLHKSKKEYKLINGGYDFREDYPECILGVRDQAKCGSCWAFSGTSVLQYRFCKDSEAEINQFLSPQDPISCVIFIN